jgi:hypothetical protein
VILAFFLYTPVSKKLSANKNPEDDKKAEEMKEKLLENILKKVPKYSDIRNNKRD